VLYKATFATEEKGRQLYQMLVEGVASAVITEFGE
jgi:hypothetical protein